MDRMKVAQFLKKRKVIGGCLAVVAAGIITAAGLYGQFAQLPEVPEIVDPILETSLEEEDTPLASAPKVTVKTTRTTKTTKKNVKLKKKATRTYTKNLGTKTKRNTQTVKRGTTTIKKDTTVATNTKERYTKKSIKKVVTTQVTTTVKTTTTVQKAVTATKAAVVTASTPASTSGTVVTASTGSGTKTIVTNATKTVTATVSDPVTTNVAGTSTPTEVSIRDVAPAMDEAVLRAFEKLRFRVIIDPSVSYSGRFVAKTRSITLKKWDTTIYHELGHFIAFVAGNADKTSAFEAIYRKELDDFPGIYKAYASQNASEFFGECTRLYITEKSSLKSRCPQTVTAIEQAIRKLTDAQIQMADRAIMIAGG